MCTFSDTLLLSVVSLSSQIWASVTLLKFELYEEDEDEEDEFVPSGRLLRDDPVTRSLLQTSHH